MQTKLSASKAFVPVLSIFAMTLGATASASDGRIPVRDRVVKKQLISIQDTAEQCGRFSEVEVTAQKVDSNVSSSTLVKRAKAQLSKFLKNPGGLWDSEIFDWGTDGELDPVNWTGRFVQSGKCLAQINKINRSYLLAKVSAEVGTQEYVGALLQKRFGSDTWHFSIRAKLLPDYADQDLIKFDTIEIYDMEILREKTDLTDLQVVEHGVVNDYLDSYSPKQLRQLFAARDALIATQSGSYGGAIYRGAYLDNPETTWAWARAFSPTEDKVYDVIRFQEFDDGSYSVYFNQDSSKIEYIVYEN